MVSSTARPHFTPGKDPVHILQEAGWAPRPVWTGAEEMFIVLSQCLGPLTVRYRRCAAGNDVTSWLSVVVKQSSNVLRHRHPVFCRCAVENSVLCFSKERDPFETSVNCYPITDGQSREDRNSASRRYINCGLCDSLFFFLPT